MKRSQIYLLLMSLNNCCAPSRSVPRRQPLLREFLKSEAYDPYVVLSSSLASTGSLDFQRELEETVSAAEVEADEREQRLAATVTKFGVCGTIDFERAVNYGVTLW